MRRVQQLPGPGDQRLQQLGHVQPADQPHRGLVEGGQVLVLLHQVGDVEIGQHPTGHRAAPASDT